MKKLLIAVFGVAVLVMGSIAIWYRPAPYTYADCVLGGLKHAQSDNAARLLSTACREKFPNRFDRFLDSDMTWEEFQNRD